MKKNKGFTLIELLAVIVILGVLLSLSAVAVNKIRKKQEQENTKNVISSILTGAKEYIGDHPEALKFPETVSVSVKVLLNQNYVDFDQNKYSSLLKYRNGGLRTVGIQQCNKDDSSNTKLKYIFYYYAVNPKNADEGKDPKYGKIEYNDCGCEKQTPGDSDKICIENKTN